MGAVSVNKRQINPSGGADSHRLGEPSRRRRELQDNYTAIRKIESFIEKLKLLEKSQ